MSNTNLRSLDGFEVANISVINGCHGNGSIEAEGTIYVNSILSYTLDTPVSLANSLFDQDGSVTITSTEPATLTSASLIVNGGILVQDNSVFNGILNLYNTTDSSNLSTGSIIIYGGVGIAKNINASGILNLYNTTITTNSSTGALIVLGGIAINSSTNATDISNGGALTIAGGASIAKTLYTNTIISNNSSISNLFSQNITSSNAYITNNVLDNISSSNILTSNISSNSLNTTDLINTNSSITNLSLTNGTINNLNIVNENVTNSTITTLHISTANIFNISSSIGNFEYVTINNLHVTTSSTEYTDIIVNISANNILNNVATIGSLQLTNGTFGSLYGNDLYVMNITSTNFVAINISASTLKVINNEITNATINSLHTNIGSISNLITDFTTIGSLYIINTSPSINSTSGALIIFNGGISINSTVNSLSITSGGAATLAGGLAVAKDVYFGGDVYITGSNYISGNLDLNNNNINNVTSPNLNLQVANKWYVDNRFDNFTINNISGNFTQSQVIVATTGGNLKSFDNFLYNGFTLFLNSTLDSTSLTNGGVLKLLGGATINRNLYVGGNTHLLGYLDMNNQKITSLDTCTTPYDAANKYYVDDRFDNFTISNISGNFTQGQVIIATSGGNIRGFSNLLYDGILLSILSTENSLGLGSGGSLTINGGVSIAKDTYFGSFIDLNLNVINNVTAPSTSLQVANKWYVDNRFDNFTIGNVFGNFTQGQIIVASTNGNITGFNNFLFDGNLLTISSTTNSLGLGSGGTLTIHGGVSIAKDAYFGSLLNMGNNNINNLALPINELDAVNKEYVDYFLGIGTGDIRNTTVSLTNNILTFTNIPFFIFDNLKVSSFISYAYLRIPELNIYDQYELRGLLKNTTWELNTTFIGDRQSTVLFNIINNGTQGQLQYKNTNTSGTALLTFRADTTNNSNYTNITLGSLIRSVPYGGTGNEFFTNGCLLYGNGSDYILTDPGLTYLNNTLYINNTTPSTNLTSGGVLQIAGGVNIVKNVFIGNGLDINGKKITNCTAPSLNLDVANKWYVDTQFNSGGSLTLDGNISLNNTTDAISATDGGAFTDLGGAGIAKKLYVGTQLFVNNINMSPSIGDIFYEQSFYAANNQNTPTNITGFNFSNLNVRYFHAFVSVTITSNTTNIAGYEIKGINISSTWQLNTSSIGQNTGITFSINSSGQIQYTSTNTSNWISTLIKFRALTTTI